MKNKLFNKMHGHHKFQHRVEQHDFKTIQELRNGEVAKIKNVIGGRHFVNKAESLGIRIGVQVSKISSQMMQGPITIKVGQTQIAIGHRMAKRIVIE